MKMNKIKAARICCFTLGTALLLSALFLVIHNVLEDRSSGEEVKVILHSLKDEIPEYTEPVTTMPIAENYDLFAEYEEPTVPEMETVEIDGNVYIGYISIPEIDIELPVLESWSYPNLKIAPCRYVGNIYENNIILCAHNYTTHFGRIRNLHTDSEIIFTDADGREYVYSVVNIEELPGTAVEELQFSNADDWDLTLFTCTISGQSRVTVRAVRETE
jgi:sortase A